MLAIDVKDWIVGAAAVLAACLTIWNFFQSPSKKNAEDLEKFKEGVDLEIDEVKTKLEDTRTRLAAAEGIIRQVPGKDDHHRLELQLEQMNTKIAGMAASAEATQRTAARVEQFLLDQAKK